MLARARKVLLLTLALVFTFSLGVGAVSGEKLRGKLKKNTYLSPLSNFAVTIPKGHGINITDSCSLKSRIGAVSYSDDFGALKGILYAPAAAEKTEASPETVARGKDLQSWFHDVALPTWFLPAVPAASVLREGDGSFEGMAAWLAVVDLPQGSSLAKFDPRTGETQRRDSRRGVVVFVRSGYFYLLMTELNVLSLFGENKEFDPENWTAFTEELAVFYRTIAFRP